jgi:hypothetical protein
MMEELFREGFLEAELAKIRSPEENRAIDRDLRTWTKRRQSAERRLKELLECDMSGLTATVRKTLSSQINSASRLACIRSRSAPEEPPCILPS